MNWCPGSDFKASVCSGERVFVWRCRETSCFSLLLQPSAYTWKARRKTPENEPQCVVNGHGCLGDKIIFRSRSTGSGEVFGGCCEQQGDGCQAGTPQRGLSFPWGWLLQVQLLASLAKILAVFWCERYSGERWGGGKRYHEGSKQADYKVMKNKGISLLHWLRRRCDQFLPPPHPCACHRRTLIRQVVTDY